MTAPTANSGNHESTILSEARAVLLTESQAVANLIERLDARFEHAVQLVLECRNRVVITGVGKSGVIGRKLASTFASTGTPALFLHAVEGLHGDLGMVMPGDVLLAISYSGRADDLTEILPVVKSMEVPIIAMTGNPNSFLAAEADVVLDVTVEKEACPLNLAPTASTTATLALGDALAVCVMGARQFTREDFARFHPGGTLGRSSKMRVADLMRTDERLARVPETATIRETLQAITAAQAGAVVVVDEAGKLSGYLTDGDVRRMLLHGDDAQGLLNTEVSSVMTRTPLSFSPELPAVNALRALQERGVDDAPVVDEQNMPVGVLDVQELLRAGIL